MSIPVNQAEYPRLTDEALAGDPAGSSAGGEQPKFSVVTDSNGELLHLLVKFSPLVTNPHGQRWSDLFVCEHIALDILFRRLGIVSADTSIVQTEERTYLEIHRFDRIGKYGRSPMHSLTLIDAEFLGARQQQLDYDGKGISGPKTDFS